jgi:serine/threonine protein kinase
LRLSDYKIEKSFTSTNGDCYITTSKLDGKRYFIKRNTDVTYGSESDPIELKRKHKKDADAWLNYHNQIRKEFTKLGNGTGTTVFPVAYFVDEGKIYELAHFVEINKIAVSDADKSKPTDKKICELDPADKIRILQTSSYALKQIHALGIIHCDLKPDNVPISKSEMGGYISKITDCGDAIFANNIPDEGQIVCTEPYWSPELAAYKFGNENVKSRLSCKNDVFAMGLIFHEWWTGDFPYYEGRDDFVNLYQVVHNSWPNKIKVDSSVPEWLNTLILDMLYPEPEKRPSMDLVFEAIKTKSYESVIKSTKKTTEIKPSFDELKKLMSELPQGEEILKYTEDSYNYLKETIAFIKANLNKLQTQGQVDKVTAKLKEAINALVVKPQDNKFKKIEDAIATIESKDLSRYTSESRDNLLKLVNFAKRQKGELTDENNINRLYSAIVNAYKALSIRNDFSIEVISPLPAPYTKVEILSDDYVMAYYGESGKIKLLADNAIKMKLIRRK